MKRGDRDTIGLQNWECGCGAGLASVVGADQFESRAVDESVNACMLR